MVLKQEAVGRVRGGPLPMGRQRGRHGAVDRASLSPIDAAGRAAIQGFVDTNTRNACQPGDVRI